MDAPVPVPDTAAEERSALLRNGAIIVGVDALWGFGIAVLAPGIVVVAYLDRFGLGGLAAGVVAAILGGHGLLQILGPVLVRSRRGRRERIMAWYALTALPFFAMAALAAWGGWLPPTLHAVLVLGALGLAFCCAGAISAVYNDWYADLFDARVRARVAGISHGVHAAVTVGGGAFCAFMLANGADASGYATLFLVAGCACLVAIGFYRFVREPRGWSERAEQPRPRALLARMRRSLASPTVRTLIGSRVLGNAAFGVGPFLTLHFIRDVGLSTAAVAACGVGATIGGAIAYFCCGLLGDRHGHRVNLLVGLAVLAAGLAVAIGAHGVGACALVSLLFGLGSGAWGCAGFLVHETTPHDSRLAHLIACSGIEACFGLLVPLVWAAVVHAAGVGVVLAASLVATLAAFAWAFVALPEPRRTAVAVAE